MMVSPVSHGEEGGNPGGDQVRRNCDWLAGAGSEGCAGIYLFYLDFDCSAGPRPPQRDIFLRTND